MERSYAKNGLKHLKIDKKELSSDSKIDQETKAMSSKTSAATARTDLIESFQNQGKVNIKIENPHLVAVQEEVRIIMIGQSKISGFVTHAKKTLATLNTIKQCAMRT